jgi:hypothetical protein
MCPPIHHLLVLIKLEKTQEPPPRALSGSTMRSKQSNGGVRVSMKVESC